MAERAATESWPNPANPDEGLAGFQAEIRAVAADLKGIFLHLAGLLTSLPSTADESSDEDLDDNPAPLLAARTAVLCGMTDHLSPLITGLRIAGGVEPAEAEPTAPALPDALLMSSEWWDDDPSADAEDEEVA